MNCSHSTVKLNVMNQTCPYSHCYLRHHSKPSCKSNQGCQFSDFSLISDFLRIKETCIKLIKYSKNMDNISIVSKDRLDNGKELDNPSLNTVSTHLNHFRLSSD